MTSRQPAPHAADARRAMRPTGKYPAGDSCSINKARKAILKHSRSFCSSLRSECYAQDSGHFDHDSSPTIGCNGATSQHRELVYLYVSVVSLISNHMCFPPPNSSLCDSALHSHSHLGSARHLGSIQPRICFYRQILPAFRLSRTVAT